MVAVNPQQGNLGNLQLPTSGTVFYEGKDITKLTKAEYKEYRRNVQYIFQDPKDL